MNIEEIKAVAREEVRITKLLRDNLKFEMALFPLNNEEKGEISIPYLDENSSERAVRIRYSNSRHHFIRILHNKTVLAVVYGYWYEGYIIAPVSGYSADIFLKKDGKLKMKNFWRESPVTIWYNAEKLNNPVFDLIRATFNQKDQFKWFTIKPINTYVEPFTDFANSELLQQMIKEDKWCASRVWWMLLSIHKDLSLLTGIK